MSGNRRLYADRKLLHVFRLVGAELGIPPIQVEAIFNSQFEFTRSVIESGKNGERESFKNVLHLHLGKFVVKDVKFKHLNEKYQNNKIRKNE